VLSKSRSFGASFQRASRLLFRHVNDADRPYPILWLLHALRFAAATVAKPFPACYHAMLVAGFQAGSQATIEEPVH